MYPQWEAIGQMHYMYDGRTQGTTWEERKAKQANARAKQTKRPSPTGTSAKTLGDRCGRSHPPPWEEKCAMSKLKEANLNFFCFLIYHFFLYFTTILHDGLKKLPPTRIFRPSPSARRGSKKFAPKKDLPPDEGAAKKLSPKKDLPPGGVVLFPFISYNINKIFDRGEFLHILIHIHIL